VTWLSPGIAAIAAGIVIPALLALYFLKLRRQEAFVSSTLLWKRAVQDLQVNAPFQRLRKNLLLLIQLLALAAALMALGRPVLDFDSATESRRHVILIDRSASMNAREGDVTRLDLAKTQAKTLVEGLRQRQAFSIADASDQAMVVAFDRTAKVMCTFTTDKRQLREAIDAIEPSDGPSLLSEALAVARASAEPSEFSNNRTSVAPATIELFSDGRIADAATQSLGSEPFHFYRIGQAFDNVAVTALQARRGYEKPSEVELFVALSNYNPTAVDCDVELRLNGDIRSVRTVHIAGLRPAAGPGLPETPGQINVTFNFQDDAGGVIEIRQLRPDALPNDDTAWALLPPPRQLAVLLVTEGNLPLHAALKACPLQQLDVLTPAEFDARARDDAALATTYNVVVLDRHAPAVMPRGQFILFGAAPPDMGASLGQPGDDQYIVDWRSRHAVLQNVNLANLYVVKPPALALPRDAEVLAEFSHAPAVALLRKSGATVLAVGFNVLDSNWVYDYSFVIFLYNATAFLGMEDSPEAAMLKVGEPLAVTSLPPGQEATVRGPGLMVDLDKPLVADASGTVRFAGTTRAGLYTIQPDGGHPRRFAVNILDEQESFIAPADALHLGAGILAAADGSPRRGHLELWPYLAAVVLLLVCAEWFIYNSRAGSFRSRGGEEPLVRGNRSASSQ